MKELRIPEELMEEWRNYLYNDPVNQDIRARFKLGADTGNLDKMNTAYNELRRYRYTLAKRFLAQNIPSV